MFETTITQAIVGETCCTCGVVFGMTREYMNRKREKKTGFFCPNGHQQFYLGKNDAEKLREVIAERDLEIARRSATETRLRDELETAERQRRSLKGKVTLIRKRIARGACPCCHSSFPDLHKHLKDKHPEYAEKGLVKSGV
jgi:hypothetical protein